MVPTSVATAVSATEPLSSAYSHISDEKPVATTSLSGLAVVVAQEAARQVDGDAARICKFEIPAHPPDHVGGLVEVAVTHGQGESADVRGLVHLRQQGGSLLPPVNRHQVEGLLGRRQPAGTLTRLGDHLGLADGEGLLVKVTCLGDPSLTMQQQRQFEGCHGGAVVVVGIEKPLVFGP